MDSYQSNGAATPVFSHSFDDEQFQNYQGQTTLSWPTTSFPTTASSSNVGNLEPAPLQDPLQQSSGPSEDRLSDSNFQCTTCFKVFPKQHKLTKHEKIHTKPLLCHLCPDGDYGGAAERKELNRHFWVYHAEYAESHNIPKEWGTCDDCGKECRSDNLTRHQKKAKHGNYRVST
ncbi:hypothetical protein NA56DRAFT_752560 [Hyaloscypha hepaticicola]|uniref:C2H2-type domain-containing protein n=1 Tax=Hyaloscypha hepaticicola TaxID=2082293 RepID=A0A2J6PT52_9HELO|nr:hypothetical protein NA56DRAFT_752560 [Hyaloscypha hepaticicola]